MGGKERICHRLLTAVILSLSAACCPEEKRAAEAVLTVRVTDSGMDSRVSMPDEDIINNVRIFIYDDSGELEAMSDGKETELRVRLLTDRSYSILAAANIWQDFDSRRIEDMMLSRYQMESPYDYKDGMAMSAFMDKIHLDDDMNLDISLERLMAKVSIRMDRSRLEEGTEIYVRSVRIGNCPTDAAIFQDSRIRENNECFDIGFELKETEHLNRSDSHGMSEDISLYLLENMQGEFSSDGPESESEKIFGDNDERKNLCSYIEMEMDYHSDSLYCTDKPLVYRFYIGDGLNSLDVERNCHYHITVRPDGDGLCDGIWRIEKGGLHSYVQEIFLSDEMLLLDYKGKSAELEAAVSPPQAFNKKLIWKSSDTRIATVDPEGLITAVDEGECIITCSSTDGSRASATCIVRNQFGPPRFASYPENKYINGDIGDTIRLWCDIFPPNTPFDIGLEYLEDDRKAGIYDYIIDDDGHGVTLILKGQGSGLIYMEALEPVNDAALYFIEVNLSEGINDDYLR